MRRLLGLLTLTGIVVASLVFGPATAQDKESDKLIRVGPNAIAGRYIVVFAEDKGIARGDYAAVLGQVQAVTAARAVVPEFVYADALQGFAASMTEKEAIAISLDPRVAYVEEDQTMFAVVTQNNATWGLDRIDSRTGLNGTYVYASTGSGVTAYVIDTGIRTTHVDFGGRAVGGFTAINDGRGSTDCNGHGTHVAGTIGGTTWGVAKAVRLVAVRVLSCSGSGSNSGVIAGVNFVTSNHAAGARAVANMSLGGGASTALDSAVNNSINDGVTYAVAAGNSNTNAANSSPARVAAAITVGSSTSSDARSSFSNFGSVVDIFAPGSSITSAWSTSNTATRTISGTSMATPHVAGVAARFLTPANASPATVRNALVADASVNELSGIPAGTANRLLFRAGTQ
jgi:aqualysin 1